GARAGRHLRAAHARGVVPDGGRRPVRAGHAAPADAPAGRPGVRGRAPVAPTRI
ncbi:MAG: hypothetical protein AVDCRST_MAG40-2714, partial [uncultured Gemmatimonadaceae bacterium]